MKLSELKMLVREAADDTVAVKYLWSDAFVVSVLNEAEVQACRRARLIIDSSSPEVCRIALAAGHSTYSVDPRVIFIRRVKLSTADAPLGFARVRDIDNCNPGWETETGDVVGWISDYTTGLLKLYRRPTAAQLPATITLTVVREPLDPMKDNDDEPEIKPRHQYALQHWALFRMFSRRDTETFDPKRAADHLALFEREFGPESGAIEEQWIDANYDYGADQGVF